MSNYDDDQSEDGELARSPIHDEMDFSLSDEDRDNADSLVIKPPQAVIRPSHRDKRNHKRSGKERYKEVAARKEKKHFYRERDKPDKSKRGEVPKNLEREEMTKEYYREKQYYREKDPYREKEMREKELYHEREMYREKDVYREKDSYREREHYREREMYRENPTYREAPRQRDVYRGKEMYKEKDVQREREMYLSRERQKYVENERKRYETEKIESRLRLLAEENRPNHNNEKENRDRTSGDKELEDLRTRLLSKRISKELQNQDNKKQPDYTVKESKPDDRQRHSSSLDRHQQERRKRLLEAEKEMEKRKHESRTELEARREERRRRGKKRSVSPDDVVNKKQRQQSPNYDSVVTVSDASDTDVKSDSVHSGPEEGEHSNSETDEETTTDSDSDAESKSADDEDDDNNDEKSDKEDRSDKEEEEKTRNKSKSKSPSPKSVHRSPSSHGSRRSISRSKSRSRSHSFSPPPTGENGKPPAEEVKVEDDDEKLRLKEEEINLLPPYFPALQGCRSVEEFQCLNRIEEGTYGVVYRARDKTTEEIVALKRLKMEKEKEGFPITSLREINTLLKARHLLPEEGCARGVTPLQGLTTSIHGRA